MITVSIVSHGHGEMVDSLVKQLLHFHEVGRIVVTINIPENTECFLGVDRVLLVENGTPRGYGENHNNAFLSSQNDYYCVVNPDISLSLNPFPILLKTMEYTGCGVVAPAVLKSNYEIEDSLRYFPKPLSLIAKFLGLGDGRYLFSVGDAPFAVDWAGGMFLLFRKDIFASLKGFDKGFYLYYEDVDICARTWQSGSKVIACPEATVIHEAHRASHKNLQHMRWHFLSMSRYFCKYFWSLPKSTLTE